MGSPVTFKIEGYEAVMKKIKQLPDKVKRREVLKILRRQAKPLQKAVIAAVPTHGITDKKGRPIPEKIKRYRARTHGEGPGRKSGVKTGSGNVATGVGGGSAEYSRGNLKKSIKIITGRKGKSRVNPTVYIGPKLRGKNDGWYGFFIIRGTKHIAPNNFIQKGAGPLLNTVNTLASNELKKYILNKAKQLNLNTT